jgi:hypothetical protein
MLSRFERWEEDVPKFALNLQNRLWNTKNYSSKLPIESFLKEG